jgi:rfaE bifunctional protein nucleotidyltransferase chain/domain
MTPTTVLAHGVFDVIHHGHIQHLQKAKELGDRLVVSVTADEFVNKGPNRPVFTASQRTEVLLALECVDEVYVSRHPNATAAIHHVKPDIYVKGAEYNHQDVNGYLEDEKAAVRAVAGSFVIIDTPSDSSSRAINIVRPTIPEDAQDWIRVAKNQHTFEEVSRWLEKAAPVKFSVVGETILDRYVYARPTGQSPKENYITYVPSGQVDEWQGGISVIGGHLRQVSKESDIVYARGCQVTKTRYVQEPFLNKVLSIAEVEPFRSWDIEVAENRVVADFGHGLFDRDRQQEIEAKSDWIAATIQANSLNFGFNRMTKWGSVDYISCDRVELELANPLTYKTGVVKAVMEVMDRHDASAVAVTLGHQGASLFMGKETVHVPAFNANAVDRIGAGDAWFGWTAPLVKVGAPIEIIALVGACAAAVHVATKGNGVANANEVIGFIKAVLA